MVRTLWQVVVLLEVWLLSWPSLADDWPTYQHDLARSGVTAKPLDLPLAASWSFRPLHPPARGWGEPESTQVYNYGIRRIGKVRYDNAYHVAAVGERVYFCASAENKVYCVDAKAGKVLWVRFTDAAGRLAPTVWKNRVYVGADDGIVRCFDAESGDLEWTFEAKPGADRAISQGRIHSLWPVRTGVVVTDGRACFAAGLFPAEGLWLYAVDAETGKEIWKNRFDDAGTANVSPQGYLLADSTRLILPSGRVSPSVFDSRSGDFLYGVQNGRALTGGTYCTLTDRYLYNGTQIISAYDLKREVADRYGRKRLGIEAHRWFNARRLVVRGETTWVATATELLAILNERVPAACERVDRVRKLRWDRRNVLKEYREAEQRLKTLPAGGARAERYRREMASRQSVVDRLDAAESDLDRYLSETCQWRIESDASESLILAAETLLAGGDGHVLAVDARSGRQLARFEVDGVARGLAVANGRLLVSTTTGSVHCFEPARGVASSARNLVPPPASAPYADDRRTAQARALAETILESTGIRDGYGLLLGGGDGRLAFEFSQRSRLSVYTVEENPTLVSQGRAALSLAQVYGVRTVIEQGDPTTPRYPPYFADLVVDQAALGGKPLSLSVEELLRVLKPHGGVAVVPLRSTQERPAWLDVLKRAGVHGERRDDLLYLTRGPLPGAGSWTHQYGNPGNTSNSGDKLAGAPFRMLWFGDPSPNGIINRHSAAPAPLSVGGRLFVQGSDDIHAHDAYNGRELWRRDIERVGRTFMPHQSSNLAARDDSLLVVVGDRCLQLDASSGETVRTYPLPARADGAKRLWGWIAVTGKTLFGSRTESGRPFRNWPEASGNTSEAVFAFDLQDHSLRWIYEGRKIPHTALAAAADRVYLLDADLSDIERKQALADSKQLGLESAAPLDRKGKPRPRELAKAVALDAADGRVLWSRPCDISDFVVYPRGGQPNVIQADGVVLLCGSPGGGDHHLDEFRAGKFERRSVIALAADDGKVLWSGGKNYLNRPTVVGNRVYAEPWAFDLRTGRALERQHPVTGQTEPWRLDRGAGGACGAISASERTLFFRSDTGAWYDLVADCGMTRRGGQRLSCWINSITAGGLLLIPEGSAECDCPYAIQCTTVMYPDPSRSAWGQFRFDGPLVPVKQLAINLGAPGDSRDSNNVIWLSWPNKVQRYNWAKCRFDEAPGSGYYHLETAAAQVLGTDHSPRFITGGRGIREFSVPLTKKRETARYTITLGFLEPDPVEPGQRTFDIVLQGETVLERFDVVLEAGGRMRAIQKKFRGVEVTDSLRVNLKPSPGATLKVPILCSVEAVRE